MILENEQQKHLYLGCHSDPIPKNTHTFSVSVLLITLHLINSFSQEAWEQRMGNQA